MSRLHFSYFVLYINDDTQGFYSANQPYVHNMCVENLEKVF